MSIKYTPFRSARSGGERDLSSLQDYTLQVAGRLKASERAINRYTAPENAIEIVSVSGFLSGVSLSFIGSPIFEAYRAAGSSSSWFMDILIGFTHTAGISGSNGVFSLSTLSQLEDIYQPYSVYAVRPSTGTKYVLVGAVVPKTSTTVGYFELQTGTGVSFGGETGVNFYIAGTVRLDSKPVWVPQGA